MIYYVAVSAKLIVTEALKFVQIWASQTRERN